MSRLLHFSMCVLALAAATQPLPTDTASEPNNAISLWETAKTFIEGKLFGDMTPSNITEPVSDTDEFDYSAIPNTFDARYRWPSCIHPHSVQGYCLGTWAFAAADALSDRFCIQRGIQVTLSPQYLLDCDTWGDGCARRTNSATAWNFLWSSGTPAASCVPFVEEAHACPTACTVGRAPFYKYRSSPPRAVSGIMNMQAEIYNNGPITACFNEYTNFAQYRSGVYASYSGVYVGQYCLKLIGWGAQGLTKYWIGAAYEGSSYYNGGYVYIKFGLLGIESAAIAGSPL